MSWDGCPQALQEGFPSLKNIQNLIEVLTLLKSVRNLTEVKEREKLMEADLPSLLNAAFKSRKKTEKLIFVTTHKTTRSHLEALLQKK